MLKFANNYINEVNTLLMETALNPKFKYYHTSNYANLKYKPKDDTWHGMDFVFINKEDKVVGFIHIDINRPYNSASISIVHNDNNFDFLSDLNDLIKKLFVDFKIPKLSWQVLIGNRAEKLYDRFISRNGGRVVGTYKKHDVALDGTICDSKIYEILREDYIEAINK